MSHSFAAYARVSHLHTATVTDDPLVLDTLVLAACALPVPFGPEDAFAEQTVFFRTVGPVVDGLRFPNLAL